MSKTRCEQGLDDRCRDEDGEIRRKRSDTRIDTLREKYGDDFASGYRGNTHLGTLLDREGADSLSDYLRHKHKK